MARPPSGLLSSAGKQGADWTADLTLHPDKTRLVDATQRGGFDFLGHHFERGRRWAGRKSQGKIP